MMQAHIKIFRQHYKIGDDDRFMCQLCGAPANSVHHILFRSHGGMDNIENLIGLCNDCHIKAHKNLISKEKMFNLAGK